VAVLFDIEIDHESSRFEFIKLYRVTNIIMMDVSAKVWKERMRPVVQTSHLIKILSSVPSAIISTTAASMAAFSSGSF